MTGSQNSYEEKFWNGAGGLAWLDNIEATEASFVGLSAKLLQRAALKPGEIVLDVGCGGGATSRKLAEQVGPKGRVLGVDISSVILSSAKQQGLRTPNLAFERLDAGTADLGAGVYDLVYSRFGVMFFADPLGAFTNLRRALKPSGRLVFMCWRSPDENPWIGATGVAANAVLQGLGQAAEAADPFAPGPFSLASESRIQEILTAAGFTSVHLEPLHETMPMGSLDEATRYRMGMGRIAEALADIAAGDQTRVEAAVRQVLSGYATPSGVHVPCAAWIVGAH